MLGRLHGSLMYKPITSRDSMDSFDIEDDSTLLQNDMEQESSSPSWKLSFPHVLVATIVSFLFGYHLGVVNEPLESIASDLGFNGNTLEEGLVVSTCLAGAFFGSLNSGWIADGVGRRRAFQLCALPMLVGATLCATTRTLAGMLLGRFLVGTGLGVGPPVASLYVTEVSPAHVRGTYGSFIQIATCLGLMASLLVGIPVKNIDGGGIVSGYLQYQLQYLLLPWCFVLNLLIGYTSKAELLKLKVNLRGFLEVHMSKLQ